jgi:hypothetical protein
MHINNEKFTTRDSFDITTHSLGFCEFASLYKIFILFTSTFILGQYAIVLGFEGD